MSKYVLLSFEAEAYHSGAEHNEELVIPAELWDEIKDDFDGQVHIHGLDGKHSEVSADIEADYVSEEYLFSRTSFNQDGERLLDMVYEFVYDDKRYGGDFLKNLQKEVLGKSKYGTAVIKFPLENKDILFENLKMYDVKIIKED
ncbi:hypothetical protein [Bacillus phage vB_BanS-Thrax5]|nr:hypothetical protein [Bacillus phage vB_BanS-Thrax5]